MRSESDDLKDADGDPTSPAADDLLRHRRIALRWALIAGVAGLIIGAIVAPYLTLLIFLALACFGTVGLLTGRLARLLGQWIDGLK